MKKAPPKIARYVFFALAAGIALLPLACVVPVDGSSLPAGEEDLGDDDDVVILIEDIPPELRWRKGTGSATSLKEGDSVPVPSGSNDITIEVRNADAYDTIEWSYNGDPLDASLIDEDTLTVDTTKAPFTEIRSYPLTVTGITPEGKPYSTSFLINVTTP